MGSPTASEAATTWLISACSTLFAEGVNGADATNLYRPRGDANIVLRCQNTSNHFMAEAYNYQVMVFKKKTQVLKSFHKVGDN